MLGPIHPEYTSFLIGAPVRRHWPLALLSGVGVAAALAAGGLFFMIIGVLFA
ncbi:MAG: hypothetical protein NUV50_04380 [Rhodospirillales bacterium]|nr:hypothetical protein [Rhodospirillales bacterium]